LPGITISVLFFFTQIHKFVADGPMFDISNYYTTQSRRNWLSAFLLTTNYIEESKQVGGNFKKLSKLLGLTVLSHKWHKWQLFLLVFNTP
jgi:hypothetical protein